MAHPTTAEKEGLRQGGSFSKRLLLFSVGIDLQRVNQRAKTLNGEVKKTQHNQPYPDGYGVLTHYPAEKSINH